MKTLTKNQELITRIIDGECMVLNPEDGYMHLLNTTGKEVWELLDACRTLEDLVEIMYARYATDVSREVLRNDICEIINSLKEHKIVMEQGSSDNQDD